MRSEPDGDRKDDSVQYAYLTLRTRILSGELAPGAVLSQVRLAQQLGISRTPLREALRRLGDEHLVTGDFNRRMRVSELNLEDIDQIYAMRIALEPLGIRATLPLLDERGRNALVHHLRRMEEAIAANDLAKFQREHRGFHLGLTAGSGPRIRRLLENLWDQSERYRLAYLDHDYSDRNSASAERLRVGRDEHQRIVDAVIADDTEACAAELVAHLQRTVEVLFQESTLTPRPRVSLMAAEARGAAPSLGRR